MESRCETCRRLRDECAQGGDLDDLLIRVALHEAEARPNKQRGHAT
ncbi:hypothetical protein [Streptomyces violascens]